MIELDHDNNISITIFENEYNTTPVQNTDTTVSFLYSVLSKPKVGPKKSNMCFVGGQVYPKRNNKNTLNRSVLTFDFDEMPPYFNLFEHVRERFMFGFATYSTHNHTEEKPRMRLVIPLDKPYELSPQEYRAAIQYITNDVLELDCLDPASEVLSQVMFLPTCEDPSIYEFDYVDEEIFILDEILDRLEVIAQASTEDVQSNEYWLDILKGKGEGGRNQSCAQLTGHLLRRFIDPYVAYEIVNMWNERNNPPLSQKELDTTFNSILRTEQTRRNEDKVVMSKEPIIRS